MKKTLSTFLALIMLISTLPAVSVTANGIEDAFFTDTRTVNYSKTWNNAENGNVCATAEDAAKYKFTVGTETYSLLDVKDNASSKYFVITDTRRADFVFRDVAEAKYFDLDTSISPNTTDDTYAQQHPSWALNSQYFEKGWQFRNWTGISSTVRAYIDFSHEWICEAAPNNSIPLASQYTITAGIAYPSANEVNTYADRFLVSGAATFATRTMRNQAGARMGYITTYSNKVRYNAVGLGNSNYQNVRPVFWLNDQFFANVKVDLETAGAAVKNEIKKIGYDNLLSIYTPGELFYLYKITPDVTFTDASGTAIASLDGQTSLKSTADLSSDIPGFDGYCILAVYDTEGLEKVGFLRIKTLDSTMNDVEITLNGLSGKTGNTAKFMIWKDLTETIRPLSDFIDFPSN